MCTFIADHEDDREEDVPLEYNKEPHCEKDLTGEDIHLEESQDPPIIRAMIGSDPTTHALVIHRVLIAS